jgi:hypothetical protein
MENQKIDIKIRLLFFLVIFIPLIIPFYLEYNSKVFILLLGYYIGLSPLIISFFYKKKKFLIFELHCFYYSLFFFLIPLIFIKKILVDDIFYLISLISILSLIILIATFYLLNFFNMKKKYILLNTEKNNLHTVYYLFLFIYLFFKIFFNSTSMIYFYFLVGLNYFIILNLKYRINKLTYLLLLVQHFALFFYTIIDFVYMDSIFYLITLLLIKWFFQRRINWFCMLMIMIILIFSSGIKNIFRQIQFLHSNKNTENIFIYKEFYKDFSNKNDNYLNTNFSALHQRLLYPYWSLSNSLRITPKNIPYLRGESYLPIFFKIFPSSIFKHQYQENFGNKFGRLYQMIDTKDFATSVNVSFITEFYINFGIIGVIVGMFLLGTFFFILEYFFLSDKKKHSFNNLIILTTSVLFCVPESNLSLILGSFMQNMFIILLIIFIKKKSYVFYRS